MNSVGLLALLVTLAGAHESSIAVYYDVAAKRASHGNNASGVLAATVSVNHSYVQTGWDHVHSFGSGLVATEYEYYSAGFGEGYLTYTNIYNTYVNVAIPFLTNQTGWSYLGWIEQHIQFLETFDPNPYALGNDRFKSQVARLFRMVHGLYDGYTARWEDEGSPSNKRMTFFQFVVINLIPEIGDIQTATNSPAWANYPVSQELINQVTGVNWGLTTRRVAQSRRAFGSANTAASSNIFSEHLMGSHCSALIRNTGQDLFAAHATWTAYYTMLREFKDYHLGGSVVSFSSYPGAISSFDDWYMTSNLLSVIETTNSVYNNPLYVEYVFPNSTSEYLRVMTANFVAASGQEWVNFFSTNNSGTYCNQWMVVDMKLYTPGSEIADNTLWVAEQLPGYIEAADVSSVLRTQGYWASYNIPYFKTIYDMSNNEAMFEQYGSFYSYTNYSRAEIFRRDAPNVNDLEGMQRIIRYNNYTTDPFSLIPNCTGATNNTCNPPYNSCLTIACRADLSPMLASPEAYQAAYGNAYGNYMAFAFGAADAKITSFSMMSSGALTAEIIAGPTTDNQPAFSWSTNDFQFGPTPLGQVDTFDFPWIGISIPLPQPAIPNPTRDGMIAGVVFGSVALVCILIVAVRLRFSPSPAATKTEYEQLP